MAFAWFQVFAYYMLKFPIKSAQTQFKKILWTNGVCFYWIEGIKIAKFCWRRPFVHIQLNNESIGYHEWLPVTAPFNTPKLLGIFAIIDPPPRAFGRWIRILVFVSWVPVSVCASVFVSIFFARRGIPWGWLLWLHMCWFPGLDLSSGSCVLIVFRPCFLHFSLSEYQGQHGLLLDE